MQHVVDLSLSSLETRRKKSKATQHNRLQLRVSSLTLRILPKSTAYRPASLDRNLISLTAGRLCCQAPPSQHHNAQSALPITQHRHPPLRISSSSPNATESERHDRSHQPQSLTTASQPSQRQATSQSHTAAAAAARSQHAKREEPSLTCPHSSTPCLPSSSGSVCLRC